MHGKRLMEDAMRETPLKPSKRICATPSPSVGSFIEEISSSNQSNKEVQLQKLQIMKSTQDMEIQKLELQKIQISLQHEQLRLQRDLAEAEQRRNNVHDVALQAFAKFLEKQ